MARLFDDASSQYLSNANAVINSYPVSISAWFNCDDDSDYRCLFTIADNASVNRITLNLDNANHVYSADVSGSSRSATTSTTWVQDTWNHAMGIWVSASERSAFLNGGGKDTTALSSSQSWGMDTTYIGVNETGSGVTLAQYMSGKIADVAVWNVELTDAEVVILAAGYSPLFVRPQSLVAYWPLASRQSPEIDLIGGYNMALSGAPTVAAHPNIYYPGVLPFSMEGAPEPPVYYPRQSIVAPDVGGIMTV